MITIWIFKTVFIFTELFSSTAVQPLKIVTPANDGKNKSHIIIQIVIHTLLLLIVHKSRICIIY